jgi:hypothetical protein
MANTKGRLKNDESEKGRMNYPAGSCRGYLTKGIPHFSAASSEELNPKRD